MLGPWIALIAIILGALGFASGIVFASPVYWVVGVFLLIFAGIFGAKGRLVHHDA